MNCGLREKQDGRVNAEDGYGVRRDGTSACASMEQPVVLHWHIMLCHHAGA